MFNWGFVGSVGITQTVAKELKNNKDVRVFGVYSRNKKHAENFAKEFNCKVFSSYLDMLNDESIDGIYIGVPHSLHYEHSKIALEKHKPVLCEKPLTLNYETSKELFELAKKNNVYFAEAMWTWFNPTAKHVRNWLNQGKIGKVVSFQGDFSVPTFFTSRKKRFYEAKLGGGALFDLGVYPVCYTYCLFGYPDKIEAKGSIKNGIDLNNKITFTYNNGIKCEITSSFMKLGNCAVKIKGEKGKIKVPFMFHASRKAYLVSDINEKYYDKEDINLYERELLIAAREIKAGKIESDYVSKTQSLDVMKIMEEIKRLLGIEYEKSN